MQILRFRSMQIATIAFRSHVDPATDSTKIQLRRVPLKDTAGGEEGDHLGARVLGIKSTIKNIT